MRPAFSSVTQAAAFALLLLFLLAMPWLAGKALLPPREQAYTSEGWRWGPYASIHRVIFEETNAIDLAFIGSSHMMWGINTPYVQAQLSAQLGRPAVVRSLCWAGPGFDALYFFTRDLLAHRQVKTLVFYDESASTRINPETPHWFRYGEDAPALQGLSLEDRGIYYFAAILGTPRNVLEYFTPNGPEFAYANRPNYYETRYLTENPEKLLGSVSACLAFGPHYEINTNFVPFATPSQATARDVLTYTPGQPQFVFTNQPLPAWQSHFALRFTALALDHGCQLVMLSLPMFNDKDQPVILESQNWPVALSRQLTLVGIPPAKLFAGRSASEIELLYADPGHLNQNGQNFFTPVITPALIQLYENHPGR